MSTSAIPLIIDALVEECAALLKDRQVSDGFPPFESDGMDYLFVGVEDPSDEDATDSAESIQRPGAMGTTRPRTEDGSVNLAALSYNGDRDPAAARREAFATTAAVEQLCRSTPNLGVTSLGLLVVSYGTTHRLVQNQTDRGASALVLFAVGFTARL